MMPKFVIEKSGASKGVKDGKHEFYAVGDVVELETLPASLVGKAKPVKSGVTPKDVKIEVVNNCVELVAVTAEEIDGVIVVTANPIEIDLHESTGAGEDVEAKLSAEYEVLSGKKPDGRWSPERISEEIDKLKNAE